MKSKGQTTPIEVADPAFLLERLAADCAPLQEYRELTRNGIDAIDRLCKQQNRPIEGKIVWDVDWVLARDTGVYKLCCVDTGISMSGAEIEKYINRLSSSASRQGLDANFGIGARITAGHKNPAGLMYFAWQDGDGVTAQFWRDDEVGAYGLKQLPRPDGTWGNYTTAPARFKPTEIDRWGTKVVLLGRDDRAHTVLPPEVPSYKGVAPGGMKWLTFYLNRRFFQFPSGVEVQVRELSYKDADKWPRQPATSVSAGAQLRTVEGARHHLDGNSDDKGIVDVEGARIWWWLLSETTRTGKRTLADSRESWESRGHVAALYQDELYEIRRLNDGSRILKMFGITFGFGRVVMYAEPTVGKSNTVTANTARSHLRLNGDELPWVEWAADFRAKLPPALKKMMEDLLAASGSKDHLDAINKRLQTIAEFLKVQRYKRNANGNQRATGNAPGGVPDSEPDLSDDENGPQRPGPRPRPTGKRGNIYGTLLEPEGDPVSPVTPQTQAPTVIWASRANGMRAEGEMEDRAAAYEPVTNTLNINRDFRVLTALKTKFLEEVGDAPNAEAIVNEVVEEWVQQQLVEAVMGVRSTLEGSKYWAQGSSELEKALSEESLTVAVMPRYHVITAVRRVLLSRLPKAKKLKALSEAD